MPGLNWDTFAELPGAAELNFEYLCRAIVRHNYSQYGDFRALANQPGVEFHLRLDTDCSLGTAGRWFGWQCRWYQLDRGRALGSTRQNKIEQAIRATHKHVPGVSDWILWTKHPLTRRDQEWFYQLHSKLPTTMKLHLWTAIEVDEHLVGSADIFRATYFGECILTTQDLKEMHERAIKPVRRRWRPEVHHQTDTEHAIRRMLGERRAWTDVIETEAKLLGLIDQLQSQLPVVPGSLGTKVEDTISRAREHADYLAQLCAAIAQGDLDLLLALCGSVPASFTSEFRSLPRRLRAVRLPAALTTVNVLALCDDARRWPNTVLEHLGNRIVAVVADAGCGKTQLTAEITKATEGRPAGIFLHGRDLPRRGGLNTLANRLDLHGTPFPSFERLLAAVDAAGQRLRCRLPLVIDGLNEAEDPRDWKDALASLSMTIEQYPYVLVVVTLRSGFVDDAIPDQIHTIRDRGFGEHDVATAIQLYLDWYKIDASDCDIPIGMLQHPLTLSIFCEVTNPTRSTIVSINAAPGSLTSLFEKYIDQARDRIQELAGPAHRLYDDDIRRALAGIGQRLWDFRTRSLEMNGLREYLNDLHRSWDTSIVRALEHEGILLRVHGHKPGEYRYAILNDALAGHLIARALLDELDSSELGAWIAAPDTVRLLASSHDTAHPLASDTLAALTALTPRYFGGQQLWPIASSEIRNRALLIASGLESDYLDAATVSRIEALLQDSSLDVRSFLIYRLRTKRGLTDDPLNAKFTDRLLRTKNVAERDTFWTEWLRSRSKGVLADIEALEKRWKSNKPPSASDTLRATWVMWTLTSTDHLMRDTATRALYWFGRSDPGALFDLTLDSLGINDSYVPERMLAAAYGVVMAHHLGDRTFQSTLKPFLIGLKAAVCGPDALHPTNHQLQRRYIEGAAIFAECYHSGALPEGLLQDGRVPFSPGPSIPPIANPETRADEIDSILMMDFENYTVGRLFDDRGNYDSRHVGHQKALSHIRGTAWMLGWRQATLGVVDGEIARDNYSRRSVTKVERYGKKYSWIGFHTYAGLLHDSGSLRRYQLSDIHIDPSFPRSPPAASVDLPPLVVHTPVEPRQWIRYGDVSIPDELLYCKDLNGHVGPWVLAETTLKEVDLSVGRAVWVHVVAVLVDTADADRAVRVLADPSGAQIRWHLEPPSDYYTFAGEVPWYPGFGYSTDDPHTSYRRKIDTDGPALEVEILTHDFVWEGYHSPLNRALGSRIPSRWFSEHFNLRTEPQSLDQADPTGSKASLSLRGPGNFEGRLLYLREDLVEEYANGRGLIWFVRGGRELHPFPVQVPSWLRTAWRTSADRWSKVISGVEYSPILAGSPKH